MAECTAVCYVLRQKLYANNGHAFERMGLLYDDLKRIFDWSTDEALLYSHLVNAGVARKPWRSKLWLHFSKKQSSS